MHYFDREEEEVEKKDSLEWIADRFLGVEILLLINAALLFVIIILILIGFWG